MYTECFYYILDRLIETKATLFSIEYANFPLAISIYFFSRPITRRDLADKLGMPSKNA